jgi:hypothetical protein
MGGRRMKNYVNISLDNYDTLIIDKHAKVIQLMKQAEKLVELETELKEKKETIDKLAMVSKFTVGFLESVNPKLVNEWRDYIKLREEEEDAQ